MTIDTSELIEQATVLPNWTWVTAGVVCWYFLVGCFLNRPRVREYLDLNSDEMPIQVIWLFHPIIIVTVAVVALVWTALAAISGGLVPWPWSDGK